MEAALCGLSSAPHRVVAGFLVMANLGVAACGGGGGGGGGSVDTSPMAVTGRVGYDKVPFGGSGLDYNNVVDAPVRGAVIEAINSADRVTTLASTSTDADGNYTMALPGGASFFLRVKAQLLRAGIPSWNVRVLNNTNSNALYVLDSDNFTNNGTPRNLRAASGWNGTSYAATRSAAPFSMLDVAWEVIQLVLTADAAATFGALDIHWGPLNRSSDTFNPAVGDIGTTSFLSGIGVFVLGTQNVDTDEYDPHVIAHEIGHYFQDAFSRDDSIGGPHGPDDRLDLRVAFSEGWGNAFSAMVKADPRYRDSFGPAQGMDFDINVESDLAPAGRRGWFNETSVQSIFFDVFDSTADGVDSVALGFAPIFQTMTGAVRTTEPFTTIFPLITGLKAQNPGAGAGIDALLLGQDITVTDIDDLGSNETHNGGEAANLPIYRTAMINAGSQEVCSSIVNTDEFNKLGNRRFLRFEVTGNSQVTFRAEGPVGSDPDLALFQIGRAHV